MKSSRNLPLFKEITKEKCMNLDNKLKEQRLINSKWKLKLKLKWKLKKLKQKKMHRFK